MPFGIQLATLDDERAHLVYSTTDGEVRLPEAMGEPKDDQLQGTALDQLAEVAGRVCYDSFGSGRSSEEWHQHVRDVGHLSVYEHCNFTFKLYPWNVDTATVFLNRPGVWIDSFPLVATYDEEEELESVNLPHVNITMNMHTVLEWDSWSSLLRLEDVNPYSAHLATQIIENLRRELRANKIVDLSLPKDLETRVGGLVGVYFDKHQRGPITPDSTWVTGFFKGSRGFSHELVRHGDFTAISQRSTRFCNEANTPWWPHPLWFKYVDELKGKNKTETEELKKATYARYLETQGAAIAAYIAQHDLLAAWIKTNQKTSVAQARKQARGAARGLLGNALETQLIFSASLRQWNHIFEMRMSDHADAEIRCIMNEFFTAMGEDEVLFNMTQHLRDRMVDAADGMGYVIQ